MKHWFLVLGVVLCVGCGRQPDAAEAKPGPVVARPAPKPPSESPVVLTGVLESGFGAIGGETTGVRLRDGPEVDPAGVRDWQRYVGKRVAVHGRYEIYEGVETGKRKILVANRIELRDEKEGNQVRNPLPDACEEIRLGGNRYKLETYIYRNMMPPSTPERRRPAVLLKLVEQDRKPVPAGVSMVKVWLLWGAEVWESGTERRRGVSTTPHVLEVVAARTPAWEACRTVDVVVEATDEKGNKRYLKALNQPIGAVH